MGSAFLGGTVVRKSVLEAIKQGDWDFEPADVLDSYFDATDAMPGTREKLSILASRVEAGLPLWHGHDKMEYDEED